MNFKPLWHTLPVTYTLLFYCWHPNFFFFLGVVICSSKDHDFPGPLAIMSGHRHSATYGVYSSGQCDVSRSPQVGFREHFDFPDREGQSQRKHTSCPSSFPSLVRKVVASPEGTGAILGC